MSTLVEIEQAASRLTVQERQELLVFLLRGLRTDAAAPPPRSFAIDELAAWMDEDEADFNALKGEP